VVLSVQKACFRGVDDDRAFCIGFLVAEQLTAIPWLSSDSRLSRSSLHLFSALITRAIIQEGTHANRDVWCHFSLALQMGRLQAATRYGKIVGQLSIAEKGTRYVSLVVAAIRFRMFVAKTRPRSRWRLGQGTRQLQVGSP